MSNESAVMGVGIKEIRTFQDLDCWKRGHELAVQFYDLTRSFPMHELYGITSHLRRATVSINANIAEGFARYHFRDKMRFYYYARGSVADVQNFIILARDLKLVEGVVCEEVLDKT